jgi:hypothetical protein
MLKETPKPGQRVICTSFGHEIFSKAMKIGKIYTVTQNVMGYSEIEELNLLLEVRDSFWPWRCFDLYLEKEIIQCDKDYYKWLSGDRY